MSGKGDASLFGKVDGPAHGCAGPDLVDIRVRPWRVRVPVSMFREACSQDVRTALRDRTACSPARTSHTTRECGGEAEEQR